MNLIDTDGSAYRDVNAVYLEKCSSTYGYELMIRISGGAEPISIGFSTPDEGILPQVREVIATAMAGDARSIDLRDHFRANHEYFGYYGATIVPKSGAGRSGPRAL